MNRERRKKIVEIREKLHSIIDDIETVKDEEQDAYDNLPESIQDSQRGETMCEYIDYLEDSIGDIGSAIDNLENVTL